MRTKTIILTCFAVLALLCLTIFTEWCPRVSPSERAQMFADPLVAAQGEEQRTAQQVFGLPVVSYDTAGGTQSQVSLTAEPETVAQRYAIPTYDELASPVTEEELSSYQMVRKAQVLGIEPQVLSRPLELQNALEEQAQALQSAAFLVARKVTFSGTTAAELQDYLNAHAGDHVTLSADVSIDTPLILPADTTLDGAGHALVCDLEGTALIAQDIEGISLRNLHITGKADCGLVAANARSIVLENCTVQGMRSKAAVFAGACTGFVIEGCDFSHNQRGGIIFTGDCAQGLISACTISHNAGCSNLMAGLVLTQVAHDNPLNLWEGYLGDEPHWPRRARLEDSLATPHDIVISGCTIEGNQSSGIYLDGAYRCFIADSIISGNDKEGMCLDYGTIACWVHDNTFEDNGCRIRQTEESLRLDYVADFGLLEDGSSAAKLPGVSLDNALYNLLEGNQVVRNWGGGIKCVRTAVRNTIVGNVVLDCNEGENDVFDFIGIEVGNALEENTEPYMDFAPDLENIIVGNYVVGRHYIGIFLSSDSAGNLVERNVVEGPWRGDYVDLSHRENTTQHDLVGTAARIYNDLRG